MSTATANATSAAASASSSSRSSSSGADVGVGAETRSANPADSCMWQGGSDCGKPRSCFDCLNVAIERDSCAIDPYGECVSISEYEKFVNRRNYYVPNYKFFPASNYSYCGADDARCVECRASWTDVTYRSVDATYCTGEGGCVCISLCEVKDYDDAVLSMQSCTTGAYSLGLSTTSTRVLIAAAVGISVAMLFFAIAHAVKRYVRTLDGSPSELDAEGRLRPRRTVAERRPPRTGPLLGLDGWKSMREKLIETERTEIQGGGATLGSQQANDAAAEAPVIVIEHGDGYRPMSPSAMAGERSAPATTPSAPLPSAPPVAAEPTRATAQSI